MPEKKSKLLFWLLGGCLGMGCLTVIGFVVVGLLASVAVPRLMDATATAQYAVAIDVASQLDSAARLYEAKQGKWPESFADFVTVDKIEGGQSHTLSLVTVGYGGACTMEPKLIDCTAAFDELGLVQYYWEDGNITYNIDEPSK